MARVYMREGSGRSVGSALQASLFGGKGGNPLVLRACTISAPCSDPATVASERNARASCDSPRNTVTYDA
eukprot:1319766-Pleurochrysis_carterae.AAC.1